MALTHTANCLVCHGSGLHPTNPTEKCPGCKGRAPCLSCSGTGRRFGLPCPACNGKATARMRKRKVSALILESDDVSKSIEVGEFASELVAAVCYRERTGLVEGDWIDDPTRALTDGACFAEEIRRPTQNTFQVTVSLDVSGSMYDERARIANPLFYAMHRAMQQSMRELPPGMLIYAPFTFGSESYQTPEAYMKYYKHVIHRGKGWSRRMEFPPSYAESSATAEALKEDCCEMVVNPFTNVEEKHVGTRIYGGGTRVSSLYEAIQKWEQRQMVSASQLTKLDIVITDGGLDSDDTMNANLIQAERAAGCKLKSVLLNIDGYQRYWANPLPDYTQEFAVELSDLQMRVRNVLMDTISELLA